MEYQEKVMKQLSGKIVLVIGVAPPDRRAVWKTFEDLELKVILVDAKEQNHGRDHVFEFIRYDFTKGMMDEDDHHANNIIHLLGDRIKTLSACFSFKDECIFLTSIMCQKLRLSGLFPDIALVVKSKQKSYEKLRSIHSPISFLVQKESDIWNVSGLTFPAIPNPECSAGSYGILKVHSLQDCADKFSEMQN